MSLNENISRLELEKQRLRRTLQDETARANNAEIQLQTARLRLEAIEASPVPESTSSPVTVTITPSATPASASASDKKYKSAKVPLLHGYDSENITHWIFLM